MSENEQSSNENKSQEPTPQKLRKSREQGDVPYSTEATAAVTYAVLFVVIIAMSGWIGAGVFTALKPFFSRPETIGAALFDAADPMASFDLMVLISTPVLALMGLLILGIAASVAAQQAMTFAPSKIKPKWSRLSFVQNVKQKYGPEGLSEFVKKAVKLCAIMAIVLFAFQDRFFKMPSLTGLPANALLQHLTQEAIFFVGLITAAATVIAAIDLPWRYFQHRRRLRMTHEEVKRENKESEGDPMLKSARRQKAEAIAANRMMADVPKADIVIVNPTHYAAALKWNRKNGSAPICVAKGVDEIAARIRETAAEHGVPIKRDPPTARSIYSLVDIGDEIKREHFAAVAAAIHYADQIRKTWPGGKKS
jgi:flagellar biosynthetic protein FlhB